MIKKINLRRVQEIKTELTIASYPYFKEKDKKDVIKTLDNLAENRKKRLQGVKLDTVGFEALKFAMSQNPRIIVK